MTALHPVYTLCALDLRHGIFSVCEFCSDMTSVVYIHSRLLVEFCHSIYVKETNVSTQTSLRADKDIKINLFSLFHFPCKHNTGKSNHHTHCRPVHFVCIPQVTEDRIAFVLAYVYWLVYSSTPKWVKKYEVLWVIILVGTAKGIQQKISTSYFSGSRGQYAILRPRK